MDIKVSVIIPAYNAERIIAYTIESALAQTLSDIEVIVVDDCSTDSMLALLNERFSDNDKVRIVPQPKNAGVSMARNRGIQEARGKYLAFLDSEDTSYIDHFCDELRRYGFNPTLTDNGLVKRDVFSFSKLSLA